MTKGELDFIINGCIKGNQLSQKYLYQQFYSYGMNISHKYARSNAEAEEMLNDAFIRVFTNIETFNKELIFRNWFHTVVVRSCINYLKKYTKQESSEEINEAAVEMVDENVLSKMTAEEIVDLIRELPPTYRAAFNLYVVEGYSHKEIAEMMNITEGTARSNLKIARQKLQILIVQNNKIPVYGRTKIQ